MATAPAAPSRLFIGVLSHASPAALQKRNLQRSLCNATGPYVTLRFVLGSRDVDADREDVLLLSTPHNDRLLGTYMLTNRLFRYALAQPDVAFVARADDDALFDAGLIAHLLLRAASMPWAASEHLVFGPFGEWFVWGRETMWPYCFDYSAVRWAKAASAARAAAGNASAPPIPRWLDECVAPNTVGPFPYAKGPLVAYSRPVAAAIAPRFEADERRALVRGTQQRLASQRQSAIYGTPQRGRRHRERPADPSRRIVYDDVYYAALVFETFRNRSLTLVRAQSLRIALCPAKSAYGGGHFLVGARALLRVCRGAAPQAAARADLPQAQAPQPFRIRAQPQRGPLESRRLGRGNVRSAAARQKAHVGARLEGR